MKSSRPPRAAQDAHRQAHGQAGRQGGAGRCVVVGIEVLEQRHLSPWPIMLRAAQWWIPKPVSLRHTARARVSRAAAQGAPAVRPASPRLGSVSPALLPPDAYAGAQPGSLLSSPTHPDPRSSGGPRAPPTAHRPTAPPPAPGPAPCPARLAPWPCPALPPAPASALSCWPRLPAGPASPPLPPRLAAHCTHEVHTQHHYAFHRFRVPTTFTMQTFLGLRESSFSSSWGKAREPHWPGRGQGPPPTAGRTGASREEWLP